MLYRAPRPKFETPARIMRGLGNVFLAAGILGGVGALTNEFIDTVIEGQAPEISGDIGDLAVFVGSGLSARGMFNRMAEEITTDTSLATE